MLDGDSWLIGGVLLFLLICSAFFSASETALTSLNKITLRNMVEERVKNADKISKLLENPNRLLSSILVGNNLVNNGASALATALAIEFFNGDAGSGAGFATAVITVVILIFSEITPKTIAAQRAEKVALMVVNFVVVTQFILHPVVVVLNVITGGLTRLFGCDPNAIRPLITQAELRTIVSVSQEAGLIQLEEQAMINNVFGFGDSKAKDVMTPRTDMLALPSDVTYQEFARLAQESGYSRMPVYQDDVDDIIGILYVKDIFFVTEEEFNAEKYMRGVFFTYESKPVTHLFQELRENHLGVAVVLDEYGGTAGLVTMEDIVEEIVGDIVDEYDSDEDGIARIKENEFLVDGSSRLEDFNDEIGSNLESDDVDTIAGYVLMCFGDFPTVGEDIEVENLKIVVEEMEKNRISKLRVFRIEKETVEA